MTKKSTKKIKEALKKVPKLKASDDFAEKVWEKAENADRPEWDQVDYGSVKIASGDDWSLNATPMGWSVWIGVLWIILSMPLWLGVLNAFKSDDVDVVPTSQTIDVELPIPVDIDIIEPMPIDELLQDDAGYIEDLDNGQFIWEAQVNFSKAFKLARMYLGPNDIFTWHGNDYTTMYIEEVVLLNN